MPIRTIRGSAPVKEELLFKVLISAKVVDTGILLSWSSGSQNINGCHTLLKITAYFTVFYC